jgi:predicted enzyme related to lactoylglutathione lyase
MSVKDVDATGQVAPLHGARVLGAAHDVANCGREVVFADPEGAVFAVIASSSGDPADVEAARGEWIWSSLVSSDLDVDAKFYQTFFGDEIFDMPE